MLIKLGEVINAYILEITPAKNKFVVCIQQEESWFLMINTENRESYDCIEISHENYHFLNNINRYISCSRIVRLDKDHLKNNFKKCGKLNNEDLCKIISRIKISKRLPSNLKDRIVNYIDL